MQRRESADDDEAVTSTLKLRPHLALSLLVTCGCSSVFADENGRAFGDDLGHFDVVATLEQSTCGQGALGSPERWEFDVELSRDDPEIYWNTGAQSVVGHVQDDGVSFSFVSETVVVVEPSDGAPENAPCTMRRIDEAVGELDHPGLEVGAFAGSLVYRFMEDAETRCEALVGVPGGFSALPCEMHYAMSARAR